MPMREALCRPLAVVLFACALAAFGLSACGGSSGSSSTTTAAQAAAQTTTGTAGGGSAGTTGTTGSTTPKGAPAGPGRFSAVRECLQRNGVKLPTRTGPGPRGQALPKGVSRTQLQAALRKCLGGPPGFPRGAGAARFGTTSNPVFRKALGEFAECMRKNGVDVPAPNTSGKGAVFDTKGLDTSSPKFRSASQKCRPTLRAAFSRRHP